VRVEIKDIHMAAYIVATVRISDPEKFAAYGAAIAGLSAAFGGERVCGGAVTEVLEGSSPIGERVVVVKFPDADSARAYIHSPGYQSGKLKRQGAAEVDMRLIVD
jgi:uncharacterized protein (DUF1330 family)